jgi:hypothetical protein
MPCVDSSFFDIEIIDKRRFIKLAQELCFLRNTTKQMSAAASNRPTMITVEKRDAAGVRDTTAPVGPAEFTPLGREKTKNNAQNIKPRKIHKMLMCL